jgi:hypothetical protein
MHFLVFNNNKKQQNISVAEYFANYKKVSRRKFRNSGAECRLLMIAKIIKKKDTQF